MCSPVASSPDLTCMDKPAVHGFKSYGGTSCGGLPVIFGMVSVCCEYRDAVNIFPFLIIVCRMLHVTVYFYLMNICANTSYSTPKGSSLVIWHDLDYFWKSRRFNVR